MSDTWWAWPRAVSMWFVLASCALGCGRVPGNSDAGPDGGLDAGFDADAAAMEPVTPPQIPWVDADGGVSLAVEEPRLLPCASGWREQTLEGGLVICEPFATDVPAECAAGEASFPGSRGCARVGRPCPTGAWPDGLPDDGSVLFVLPGASAGDGTRGLPYGSAQRALAAARRGTTVMLGSGDYAETLGVPSGVTLRGVCAARVHVLGDGTGEAVISVRRADVRVEDLSVGPSPLRGLDVRGAGAAATLRGLEMHDVAGGALSVFDDARATAQDLSFGVVAFDAAHEYARAVDVFSGGELSLMRASIRGSGEAALGVAGTGSVLTADGVVAWDTGVGVEPSTFGSLAAVFVEGGAEGTFRNTVLLDNVGAFIVRGGAELTLEDSLIRDVRAGTVSGSGYGLVVVGDADTGTVSSAHIDRVRVEDTASEAVAVVAALVDARDLWIRRAGARGILSGRNSDTRWDRLRIDDASLDGVTVTGDGARAVFAELNISGGGESGSAGQGIGLLVLGGAQVDTARVHIERARVMGAMVGRPGSSLTLSDAWIEETRPNVDGLLGLGVLSLGGGALHVERAVFDRNHGVSVFALSAGGLSESSVLELTDAWIRDTLSPPAWPAGRGVEVGGGARATLRRVGLLRQQGIGVMVYLGASLTAENLLIHDIRVRSCGDTCTDGYGASGSALVVASAATARVSRFAFEDAALCGAMVVSGAALDLTDGRVSRNEIGACVQVDGYDVSRLTADVAYAGNRSRDVESTGFPEPPASPLGSL